MGEADLEYRPGGGDEQDAHDQKQEAAGALRAGGVGVGIEAQGGEAALFLQAVRPDGFALGDGFKAPGGKVSGRELWERNGITGSVQVEAHGGSVQVSAVIQGQEAVAVGFAGDSESTVVLVQLGHSTLEGVVGPAFPFIHEAAQTVPGGNVNGIGQFQPCRDISGVLQQGMLRVRQG